ncbi:MAG: hypothetical protein JWQ71_3733 [Pedosphaera sp.]|nr:hypothetical protein [Pedosphaera sp.]
MTKKPTPRLDALLNKVQSACEGAGNYGRKSELARYLGVSPQFVNNWIVSRAYEPSGEVTLAMLEWVQAKEGKQQKSRGSVSAPPRPKTRKPVQANEKINRVRKKR